MQSEVRKLKERLAEETRNSKRAAEYGSLLLQKNATLKDTNNSLMLKYDSAVSTIEECRQQIHKLTSNLETKSQSLKLHESELEFSRGMCEELQKKLSKQEESQRRTADIFSSNKRLEIECAEKTSLLDTLTQKVELLERQLVEAENRVHQSTAAESFTEPIELKLLLNENQALLEQHQKLEERLLELEKNKLMTENRETKLRGKNEELLEELNSRDKELNEYSVQIRKVQQENDELLAEIENLKMEQLDSKKRGNSLFSEVEDNRKALENEVKSLRSIKKTLQEKDEVNTKEIGKLKHRVTLLVNSSSQQGESKSYIQKLKQSLSQSRGEIEELNIRLKSSEEKRKLLENGNSARSPLCDSKTISNEDYAFMGTLVAEKDKEIQELESKIKTLRLTKTSLNNELIKCNRQFYTSEQNNSALKSENVKLKLRLETFNLTNVSHGKVSKHITKVEKIPGFEIKQSGPQNSGPQNTEIMKSSSFTDITGTSPDTYENKENKLLISAARNKLVEPNALLKMPLKNANVLKNEPVSNHSKSDGLVKRNTPELHKRTGKQMEVPCVLVTSDDASNINDCKQQ